MTSRTLYDLTSTFLAFNDEQAKSNDDRFAQSYFSLTRLQRSSEDRARVDGVVDAANILPYKHGGLIPSGIDVLSFSSSLPNSILCPDCTTMLRRANTWQSVHQCVFERVDISYQKLLESSKNDCHLCFLQLKRLDNHALDQLQKISHRDYYFWKGQKALSSLSSLGGSAGSRGLDIRYYIEGLGEPRLLEDGRQTCLILAEAEGLNENAVSGPYIPGTTVNAANTWQLLRDWIHGCEVKHKICQELKRNHRVLPTRLMKLSDNNPNHASVVKTDNLPIDTKYITLSHKWGETKFQPFIQTRSASYFELIQINTLPPLFQDVAVVAKELQISYIWIDAFCIKQDSDEDWIRESARMGDVYRFSWCNIAASKATSSDESFFAIRDALEVKPCILQTQWDCSDSNVGKRWMAFSPDHLWERNVQEAPLAERAWVVQELALASRVVHYGRSQIFWECSEMRACETCPVGIPGLATKKLSLDPSCLQFEITRAPTREHQQYQIWSLLVTKYSAGSMSKVSENKLVALSGLAKSIGQPAEEYLAGLWKQDLAYQLLWRSTQSNIRAPPTGPGYQAPSWSWASVNGPIKYRTRQAVNDPDAELLVTIIDSGTKLQDKDPTGRVVGGHLTVSSPLAKAKLGVLRSGCQPQYKTINGGIGNCFIDGGSLNLLSEKGYYCMPVEVKTRKGEGHLLVVGLVLQPSEHQEHAFQRCAYFTVSDHEDRKKDGETMRHFWKSFRVPARQPSPVLARESRTSRTAAAVVYGLLTYEFTIV